MAKKKRQEGFDNIPWWNWLLVVLWPPVGAVLMFLYYEGVIQK